MTGEPSADALPGGGAGDRTCAHAERVDGICVACKDCLHELVLNGACYYCGDADLDPVALSNKPVPADVFVQIRPKR